MSLPATLALAASVSLAQPQPKNLLCEWRPSGEVIADPCPEFYWEATAQAAYEIAVATSPDRLDEPDMWRSGPTETRLTLAEYAGSVYTAFFLIPFGLLMFFFGARRVLKGVLGEYDRRAKVPSTSQVEIELYQPRRSRRKNE